MAAKNLPFLLQTALSLLPVFILSLKRARPGAIRAMRPERRESLEKVLYVLLLHCSLQYSGAFCQITRVWVRPLTIEEIAKLAGLKFCNVVRCLADLRALGYIMGTQIKRKNQHTGRLEVSPGLRIFTMKFWEDLGLKDKFVKAVKWARENCNQQFKMRFKSIAIKVKEAAIGAKKVVNSVMQKMLDPDAERVKNHCSRILAMLKRNNP